MKYVQKSEILALKTLYQLQKIGYFQIFVFRLKSNISGSLIYNFFFSVNEKNLKLSFYAKFETTSKNFQNLINFIEKFVTKVC